MASRWSCLTVGVLLLPALVLTQGQTPTFRGSAVLVTVDAYPQQNGRVVEGLNQEDFDVLEDGAPQKVENFQFVRVEPALTEDSRRDPNSSDEGNRLAADPRSRVFVAYLDQYHVSFDGSHATRQPLVETLRRVMAPTDLFGAFTPKMRPQDLTLGRKLTTLEDELTRYWPWGERFSLMHDPEEDYLNTCLGGALPDDIVRRRREDKTLTSLADLVAHLGGIRDARSVVLLFTDGWLLYQPDPTLGEKLVNQVRNAAGGAPPLPGIYTGPGGRPTTRASVDEVGDIAACTNELLRLTNLDDGRRFRDLIAEANRRNVSFYPVNPAGLAVFDEPLSVNKPLDRDAQAAALNGQTPLSQDRERLTDRLQNLRTLAENTDGLAVLDTNDLSAGLRKVVDDVSAYYLLGYYSTNTKLDGNYHRIQVRMRRPGVTVKARRGYFAPDQAVNAPRSSAAPPPAAGAALVAEAIKALTRLRTSPELFIYGAVRPAELTVVAEIPGRQTEGGKWAQGGEALATVTGPNGELVGTASGQVPPSSRGVLLRVPLGDNATGPWRVEVKLIAGGDRLEDRATIELGKATTLLGAPVIYRAAQSPRATIQPVADFQFRRTERVHIEWPMLKALDQRQARLLGQNGQPLTVAATLSEREANGQNSLAVDVNLAPLSPADYVLEVVAGSGRERVRRLLAIRIVP